MTTHRGLRCLLELCQLIKDRINLTPLNLQMQNLQRRHNAVNHGFIRVRHTQLKQLFFKFSTQCRIYDKVVC